MTHSSFVDKSVLEIQGLALHGPLRLRRIRAFRVTSATTRCSSIRSAHAETLCPRGDSLLGLRARSVSRDKAILAGARTEPRRCPVRLRVPHLRTGPSIGRGCLRGLPHGKVCSGFLCDRVRRHLHRAPRLPRQASTAVRVRDSAVRIVVARQRRERRPSRLPTRSRRRESLHRRSCHAGQQDSAM